MSARHAFSCELPWEMIHTIMKECGISRFASCVVCRHRVAGTLWCHLTELYASRTPSTTLAGAHGKRRTLRALSQLCDKRFWSCSLSALEP